MNLQDDKKRTIDLLNDIKLRKKIFKKDKPYIIQKITEIYDEDIKILDLDIESKEKNLIIGAYQLKGEKDLLLSCKIKRDKTIDEKTNIIKKITEIYDKNIDHLESKEKFYQRNLDYLKELS